jgi:hypothetical protein
MRLNIPKINGNRFLICGAGGGFDVFAGLPLAYELGLDNCWFANYGNKKFGEVKQYSHPYEKGDFGTYSLEEIAKGDGNLELWGPGNGPGCKRSWDGDYPEEKVLPFITNDCFTITREGVLSTHNALQGIVSSFDIDSVIMVDGGVDSLMKGDEAEAGTVLEDIITLTAANLLRVPNKYLMCLGFGAETEENLNHYRVLENMAQIISKKGFLGSCSLTRDADAYKFYRQVTTSAWGGDDYTDRVSHIHSRVIPSVDGHFGNGEDHAMVQAADARVHGDSGNDPFLSALSGIMWFFNLRQVVQNKDKDLIHTMERTSTFTDAFSAFRQYSMNVKEQRSKENLPL